MEKYDFILKNECATIDFGVALSAAIGDTGLCVYLVGDLGAGKTTLSRGIMRGYGYDGAVKSPTYTIVEPYTLNYKGKPRLVTHFDFYRLNQPSEVEFLGLENYFSGSSLCLIEWPNRGKNLIPEPDIKLNLYDFFEIKGAADAKHYTDQRSISFEAFSSDGKKILTETKKSLQSSIEI